MSFNKKIAVIFFLLVIGGLLASPVLARELEEEYPEGGPTSAKAEPGSVVAYIYRMALAVSGIIAFGVFIFGGFKYLTSAGNPRAINSAKSYMMGAFLSIVLLLSIYLILKTINPDILYPDLEKPKPYRGVCFYGEGGESGERRCLAESLKEVPISFEVNSIEFRSSREELKGIYLFGEKDWEGEPEWHLNNKFSADKDASSINIGGSVKSFFLVWERTGVYLFKEQSCEPDFPNQPYQIQTSNIADLKDYREQVKSIHFKNKVGSGTKNNPDVGYIAVFHENINYEGNCGIAFGNDPSHPEKIAPKCASRGINDLDSPPTESYIQSLSRPIGSSVKSMQTFNYDFGREASGKITFYEKTNYKGDRFELGVSDLQDHGIWRYLEKNNIEYPFSADKQGDKPSDNGEMERILSVKIEGDLLLIITRDKGLDTYCQIFKKSDPDLSDDYVIRQPWDAKIHSLFIIPLHK